MPETHEVRNQPPPLEDYDLYGTDPVLGEAVAREGAGWAVEELASFGRRLGCAEVLARGYEANREPPRLRTHDRFGHRLDRVDFHPAWHELMALGVAEEVHCLPWSRPGPGAHVARVAKHYLLSQVEAGVGCPLTMTYAAVPALRHEESVAEEWVPRLCSKVYDPSFRPAGEKEGCLVGMAMTEKQGGSDVRSNTTRAEALGAGREEFRLTGHKWFCSAPMCDAFLTLAYTEAGLGCFLVPRWRSDGSPNPFLIQRLKDKLGNRSNASSEIEYRDTWARRVGPEGRGIATILEMVGHTRLDCMVGSAALMRQALAQALHHTRHRRAFGRRLYEQPLMRSVLADLALESEAALQLTMRVARAYDEAAGGEETGGEAAAEARAFGRIATAVGKYWVCKRAPAMVCEALECHGGNGYVEESVLPRLFRESPLSSIWEGSGNVMCLDVLRALGREPAALPALRRELEAAEGGHPLYDAHLRRVDSELAERETLEPRARRVVEALGLGLQASLLLRHAPTPVAEAFCAARLGPDAGREYGALPPGLDLETVLERSMPEF